MRTVSTVRLVNAIFYAHHGVKPEEGQLGARFEVDVSMDTHFEEAARKDDLTATIDYEIVYQCIQEIVQFQRFQLLERLAYLIAEKIMQQYDVVEAVEVAVRKPTPPIGGISDYAEVVYRKQRPSDR